MDDASFCAVGLTSWHRASARLALSKSARTVNRPSPRRQTRTPASEAPDDVDGSGGGGCQCLVNTPVSSLSRWSASSTIAVTLGSSHPPARSCFLLPPTDRVTLTNNARHGQGRAWRGLAGRGGEDEDAHTCEVLSSMMGDNRLEANCNTRERDWPVKVRMEGCRCARVYTSDGDACCAHQLDASTIAERANQRGMKKKLFASICTGRNPSPDGA